MDSKTKTDRWIQIAAVILVPVSIAVAGHLFGLQMKNAELELQKQQFNSEHSLELAMQEANWRITKSELVYKFMDALTSKEEINRKIAVEAILIALPEDGPRIVAVVAENDPAETVKDAASSSINRKILQVTNAMFSESKRERIAGTETAVSGWLNSDEFMKLLLNKAIDQRANADGVWNTVVYLENNSAEFLRDHRNQILQLQNALREIRGRENTLERLNKNVLGKMN